MDDFEKLHGNNTNTEAVQIYETVQETILQSLWEYRIHLAN